MVKVKWGILGYARIARLFTIPSILNSSNSEFYAIASRDEDKLKECQEKYGCKKTYLSYDELLCDPKVDAVYIPLPNSLHKEWVIKSVEKGKHVLCEKPISINAKEAVEMKEASIKNNVKLMEGYMYRYTDRTKKLQEILDSGVIGDIKYINSTFRFFLDRENTIKMKAELGGGSIYDVGCYPLNFVGMIMDEKPISISAEYVDQDSVDIMFTGTLRYKDGVIAVINSGFNAYDRNHSEIIGTKGIIEIPDTFLGNAGTITITTEEGKKEVVVEESERYQLEIEDFADAIINNREFHMNFDDSIRDMEILDRLIALR
ncbi:MAG TPA: Gfo/Idh/MocA family oxidoreductase [Tissierellales bacterium]|nr:Gfo/Idh/MocA family oxidoreductase [Tissierellales bacterium]